MLSTIYTVLYTTILRKINPTVLEDIHLYIIWYIYLIYVLLFVDVIFIFESIKRDEGKKELWNDRYIWLIVYKSL